jgi:hypothetical protein
MALVLLAGCRGGRQLPSYATDSTVTVHDTIKIIDTLYFPFTDMYTIAAFFQCDSNLNVVLKEKDSLLKVIDTLPAVRIRTIYKDKVIEKILTKTEVKPVIVEKKVVPTWLYIALIVIGVIALALLFVAIKR